MNKSEPCACPRQKIHFADIYLTPNSYHTLYELLKERTKEQSISHVSLPTMAEHIAFIRSRPYEAWYLIHALEAHTVGAIYLTRAREVGIFIFRHHMGQGYGCSALEHLRERHPGRILANVNPANKPSLEFFKKHGGVLIQQTYAIPPLREEHHGNESKNQGTATA